AQLCYGFRRFLEILEHLPLLSGEAPCLLEHRAVQLLGRDRYIVSLPHFRKQQPESHPALGDRAVIGLELVLALRRLVGIELAALLALFDLLPNLRELHLDHALGNGKVMGLGEGIEEGALEPRLRELAILPREALAHALAQRLKALEAQI